MKKTKSKEYKVSLTIGDTQYTSAGKSVFQAIRAIKPKHIKAKGIFRLEYDGKVSEIRKSALKTKFILTRDLNAELFGKYLALRLK